MSWFDQLKHRSSNAAAAGRAPSSGGAAGKAQGTSQPNMPPSRAWLTFLIVLRANYMLVRYFFPEPEAPVTVPYTAFKEEVARGNVESIYSKGESIEGRFAAQVTWPPPKDSAASPAREGDAAPRSRVQPQLPPRTADTFTTTLPLFVGPGLETFLIEHEVEISAVPIQSGGSGWSTLLFGFGPAILIIGFYVWLFRRAQKGGRHGGRNDGHRQEQSPALRPGS